MEWKLKKRVEYIDFTRGVFIILMILVHAATFCEENFRERVQHIGLFAVATTGFTMLSGYTVGVLGGDINAPEKRKRLYFRSLEILCVMFVSNLLMTLTKLYAYGEIQVTVTLSWFLGLFTFQTPYGISGVLFPIALLLLLLPSVYWTELFCGVLVYAGWASSIVGFILIGQVAAHELGDIQGLSILRFLLKDGAGGFAVVPFIGYGILGYATARIVKHLNSWYNLGLVVVVATASAVLLTYGIEWCMNLVGREHETLLAGLQTMLAYLAAERDFLIASVVGMVLVWTVRYLPVLNCVGLLGRFALFVFILHRIVGQGIAIALHLKGGGVSTFLGLSTSIIGLTWVACYVRIRCQPFDRLMTKIYL